MNTNYSLKVGSPCNVLSLDMCFMCNSCNKITLFFFLNSNKEVMDKLFSLVDEKWVCPYSSRVYADKFCDFGMGKGRILCNLLGMQFLWAIWMVTKVIAWFSKISICGLSYVGTIIFLLSLGVASSVFQDMGLMDTPRDWKTTLVSF